MREEIAEPQHWRSHGKTRPSWSSRCRTTTRSLAAELVDAAFNEEGSRLDAAETSTGNDGQSHQQTYSELVDSLNSQLAQLESHREQIQRLLVQATALQD